MGISFGQIARIARTRTDLADIAKHIGTAGAVPSSIQGTTSWV
jgi:hypothetical protein